MTNDITALIANIALALSLIVAVIFGIAQARAANRDRRERLTLDTIRRFQTNEFAALMFNVNAYNVPPTFEEWKKLPVNDQIMFLQFTQEMESLGILVAEKFINIELVDKTLGSFVTNSWDKFRTVLLDIRVKQSDPFLSEYFQWLAEKLKERMETNPRKPFFETAKK